MKKDNYTSMVIKDSYKELIYKIITSIFIRGLLLSLSAKPAIPASQATAES